MGFSHLTCPTMPQGSVPISAFTQPVLFIGCENMNRAVHSDVVVVKVFDERDWKAPADEVVDQEGRYSTLIVVCGTD